MSVRSVWAFTMASRRRTIENDHTDRTRIFYRTCEKKQQIECIFLCDSVIAHACQNITGPTGERARDNSRAINNL